MPARAAVIQLRDSLSCQELCWSSVSLNVSCLVALKMPAGFIQDLSCAGGKFHMCCNAPL